MILILLVLIFDIAWGIKNNDKEEGRMGYLYLKYYYWFRNCNECQIIYMKYINNELWIRFNYLDYYWFFY
jgi:hypothetical protein